MSSPVIFTWPIIGSGGANEPVTLAVSDLGQDIDLLTDLPKSFVLTAGQRNLANAIGRRLTTPRGGLFYDQDYGLDIRGLLNAGLSDQAVAALEGQIEAECRKDDRINDARADVTFIRQSSTARIHLELDTGEGPFRFIVAIDDLTTTIMQDGIPD